MARTNKMWILKKKQQQAKQKKVVWEKKTRSNDWEKRTHTNPLGNEYVWFMRSWKWISDATSAREDPDGFRIRRKPSWGELQFVMVWNASWAYRRWKKRNFKSNR